MMADDLDVPNDPDVPDEARKVFTMLVAALLFASAEDYAEGTMKLSFDTADKFIAMAEERYGKITDE